MTLTVFAVEHVNGHGGDAFALGGQVKKHVEEALKSKGAVLVRGLPVTTPETCTQFVDGLQYQEVKYEPANGPRKKVGERLDAATNIPGAFYLPVHNEMAYNPYPNKKIIMICLHPAQEGGESLIASGAEITAAIPPEIIQTFEAKGGVRYTRHWRSAKQQLDPKPGQFMLLSWQERTGCTSLAEAVQYWRRLGCEAQCCEDGSLIAWNTRPACVPDPVSGEPLWFNIVHTSFSTPVQPFCFTVTYGDGDPIPPEVVDAVTRAMAASTRAVKLGAGDMLVLDNYRYLHGRMPYKGDDRVMVTVLTAD